MRTELLKNGESFALHAPCPAPLSSTMAYTSKESSPEVESLVVPSSPAAAAALAFCSELDEVKSCEISEDDCSSSSAAAADDADATLSTLSASSVSTLPPFLDLRLRCSSSGTLARGDEAAATALLAARLDLLLSGPGSTGDPCALSGGVVFCERERLFPLPLFLRISAKASSSLRRPLQKQLASQVATI